ncbi:MAG: PP2C family serine/threonine-protein phosphatase [Candidatus Pacebacteria bacterium]|nr:PP2C family serine/threonine-protein phosphatase [Candidatus Paceibacterota bacterium]
MMKFEEGAEDIVLELTPWSIVGAAVSGAAHRRDGLDCQDYFTTRQFRTAAGESLLLVLLADGAGSASHGLEGAKLACEFITQRVEDFIAEEVNLNSLNRPRVGDWFSQLRQRIQNHAELNHQQGRDYATTLSFALITDRESLPSAVFVQLGDSTMVYRTDPVWQMAFWPQRGEYANTTYFVTDEDSHLRFDFITIDQTITEVAMITDGLERLALNHHRKEIHQPFFDDLLATVRRRAHFGFDLTLSAELASYLSSPAITSRCDDDCTIVMATVRGSHGD